MSTKILMQDIKVRKDISSGIIKRHNDVTFQFLAGERPISSRTIL